MKRILSLFLSVVMALSITAGVDWSAYASYDSISTAYNYSFGTTYYGNITRENPRDYLKFSLRESGKITFEFKADVIYEMNGGRHACVAICNANGETIYVQPVSYNSNRGYCYILDSINLNAGTYYFFDYSDYYYSIATGNFSVKIDYTPYHTYNSGKVTKPATTTAAGVKTYTCVYCNTTKSETIPKISSAKLSKTSYTYDGNQKNPTVTVKDSMGKTLKKGTDYTLTYSSGRTNAGTYYVTVNYKGSYSGSTKLSFKINKQIASRCTATLSTTATYYNGSVKTPSVTIKDVCGNTLKNGRDYTVSYASGRKSVGRYAVKITYKGNYSGSKTLYFNIIPKGVSKISKITSRSKGFTVQWTKQTTQTTGYQIQYSTSSNFKNAKTITMPKSSYYAKKVTGLKANQKYYVRVRTYKVTKFNGKNYNVYSYWCAAKSVVTKK